MKKARNWKKILFWILITALVVPVAVLLAYFPGQQTLLSLTLATGIGVEKLQDRVDEFEEKAIRKEPFSKEDKVFLKDFIHASSKLT